MGSNRSSVQQPDIRTEAEWEQRVLAAARNYADHRKIVDRKCQSASTSVNEKSRVTYESGELSHELLTLIARRPLRLAQPAWKTGGVN